MNEAEVQNGDVKTLQGRRKKMAERPINCSPVKVQTKQDLSIYLILITNKKNDVSRLSTFISKSGS